MQGLVLVLLGHLHSGTFSHQFGYVLEFPQVRSWRRFAKHRQPRRT